MLFVNAYTNTFNLSLSVTWYVLHINTFNLSLTLLINIFTFQRHYEHCTHKHFQHFSDILWALHPQTFLTFQWHYEHCTQTCLIYQWHYMHCKQFQPFSDIICTTHNIFNISVTLCALYTHNFKLSVTCMTHKHFKYFSDIMCTTQKYF